MMTRPNHRALSRLSHIMYVRTAVPQHLILFAVLWESYER
jgi:hypothetical protein